MNQVAINSSEPVHMWFGLTYAQYFIMARSILQSMPKEWQRQFVTLIEQIPEILNVDDLPGYKVRAVNEHGKTIKDHYANYERGRRQIPVKEGISLDDFKIDHKIALPAIQNWIESAQHLFPLATWQGGLIHAKEELEEILEEKDDNKALVEFADAIMCIAFSLSKRGFTLQDLNDAIANKQIINEAREWKFIEDGNYYKHVK